MTSTKFASPNKTKFNVGGTAVADVNKSYRIGPNNNNKKHEQINRLFCQYIASLLSSTTVQRTR